MNETGFICNRHSGIIKTDGVAIYENEFAYVDCIGNSV